MSAANISTSPSLSMSAASRLMVFRVIASNGSAASHVTPRRSQIPSGRAKSLPEKMSNAPSPSISTSSSASACECSASFAFLKPLSVHSW